jgi:hypothetical protein
MSVTINLTLGSIGLCRQLPPPLLCLLLRLGSGCQACTRTAASPPLHPCQLADATEHHGMPPRTACTQPYLMPPRTACTQPYLIRTFAEALVLKVGTLAHHRDLLLEAAPVQARREE